MDNKQIANRNSGDVALDRQWRLMNEALARLDRANLKQVSGAGRLIFALDLTGSREHSLYQARIATAAMFDTIKAIGAVAVKLIYYRGSRECRASPWHDDPGILSQSMRRLSCETGETQIARVLRLVTAEKEKISGGVQGHRHRKRSGAQKPGIQPAQHSRGGADAEGKNLVGCLAYDVEKIVRRIGGQGDGRLSH